MAKWSPIWNEKLSLQERIAKIHAAAFTPPALRKSKAKVKPSHGGRFHKPEAAKSWK